MEITEMKDVIKGILEGEFDEELKIAQKDQENEENFGLEISINRNLAKQIDEIMKKKGGVPLKRLLNYVLSN